MKNIILKGAVAGMIALAGTTDLSAAMPENLYMIGNGTTAGWDCNNPVQMTKVSDDTFTFEGPLFVGELKLPWVVGGAMWSSNTYMPLNDKTEISRNGIADKDAYLSTNGNPDYKWNITDEGIYSITFKVTDNGDFGLMSAEWKSELPKHIYMLGSAVDKWYSDDAAPVFETTEGVYQWEGNINYYNENKGFKFCLTQGSWDSVTFLVPIETNLNDNVLVASPGTYAYQESREDQGGLKDWFWGVPDGKSGRYKVTVDTNAKTVTLDLIKGTDFDKDNVTELYMLGLAAESFDSGSPLPMTSKGNGIFEWSGRMALDTTDGDENHANKQFKFCTPKGDWNQVFYLVPAEADADGYIQELSASDTPVGLKMVTWRNGKEGVDAFFGLTSDAAEGTYTITVNVPQMSFTLTEGRQGSLAENFIGTENATVEIYDLAGRKAGTDVTALPSGIYLVKKGGKTLKMVK